MHVIFEDHEFYHKWAPIIRNEIMNTDGVVTNKGYLKCDLRIQPSNRSFEVSEYSNITNVYRKVCLLDLMPYRLIIYFYF
jgi:hypothetical protein